MTPSTVGNFGYYYSSKDLTMSKIKHVLGISGGKDSAALAIYLRNKHPDLDITYYYCDTGKELDETYRLIENLESYLGKNIQKLKSDEANKKGDNPFDYYYKIYRGYLPSTAARWCTKNMKLKPFENFVGSTPTISYVGIRGDEDREGYISTKPNIQSIFPFRRNIWSEGLIRKLLANENIGMVEDLYHQQLSGRELDLVLKIVRQPLEFEYQNHRHNNRLIKEKLEKLLDKGVIPFNKVVFNFIKNTDYPLAKEEYFPLLENDEVLKKEDIFQTLEDSGVGIPEYYQKMEFEVDGKKGFYNRSRSGCFFCFFQQKIEWVWLLEQHPDLYEKAMKYENEDEGFTWNADMETLKELKQPKRLEQIKRNFLKKQEQQNIKKQSNKLIDILEDENAGCPACFI